MDTLVVASGNKDKIREISQIASVLGIEVLSKEAVGLGDVEPEEDGETFEENSYKKANAIMKLSGKPTVADDSGLEVEYLDGEPGIYSARFAGDDCNYDRNNAKLLSLMEDVPYADRRAKFVTVMTLVYPDGRTIVARGECHGHIITELAGEEGFGYDPVFIPDGYQQTFAQMGTAIKNKISHRAKALESLREQLIDAEAK